MERLASPVHFGAPPPVRQKPLTGFPFWRTTQERAMGSMLDGQTYRLHLADDGESETRDIMLEALESYSALTLPHTAWGSRPIELFDGQKRSWPISDTTRASGK
jgi:hypothetical protein